MRIVITGAAGRIGRELVDELSDHELILFDRRPPLGSVRLAHLSWPGIWMTALRGADCVIHLAASPGPSTPAFRLIRPNYIGPLWLLFAAMVYRVPKVVFASSAWVVRETEHRIAPQCYEPHGPKIGGDAFGPRTSYGWSKAWGELLGRLITQLRLVQAFIAVRIGWFGAEAALDERGRHIWLGKSDLRAFFRQCVEVKCAGFHVVYAVSAQASAPYDLAATKRLLNWKPAEHPPAMSR